MDSWIANCLLTLIDLHFRIVQNADRWKLLTKKHNKTIELIHLLKHYRILRAIVVNSSSHHCASGCRSERVMRIACTNPLIFYGHKFSYTRQAYNLVICFILYYYMFSDSDFCRGHIANGPQLPKFIFWYRPTLMLFSIAYLLLMWCNDNYYFFPLISINFMDYVDVLDSIVSLCLLRKPMSHGTLQYRGRRDI